MNLRAFRKDWRELLAASSATIEAHLAAFRKENPSLVEAAHHRRGVNQAFFEWQRAGGWDRIREDPSVQVLERWMNTVTDIYLQHIGLPGEELRGRNRSLHVWATANYHCIGHLAHTHPDHLVSGVVYAQVPPNAGPIQFQDPR